ncbi:hypothetical protein [Marinicellulosiphila megalodicopiae]|uniref:hypothetical protein n=1 Tax=Marinicellulosiphila megalodicopiae TaxID=2724896 RepID=UPI003BAFDDF9
MIDSKSVVIVEGDYVEILSINEESLEFLEPHYAKEIREAVGQKLVFDFIDENDRAWVDLIKDTDDEIKCGQTLFLQSHQISKI